MSVSINMNKFIMSLHQYDGDDEKEHNKFLEKLLAMFYKAETAADIDFSSFEIEDIWDAKEYQDSNGNPSAKISLLAEKINKLERKKDRDLKFIL